MIDVSAHDLDGMLADLTRTAGTDPCLPMINGIALHSEKSGDQGDNRLYGTSTNRFVFSQAWEPGAGSLACAFIHLEGVRLIRAALRHAIPHSEVRLSLKDAGDTLEIELVGVANITVPTREYSLPDMEKLVSGYDENRERADRAKLSAKFVSDLGMIGKRRREFLHLALAADLRPATVDIGDNYRAMIMPARYANAGEFRYSFPPRSK